MPNRRALSCLKSFFALLVAAALYPRLAVAQQAQTSAAAHGCEESLQSSYDAAQKLQAAADIQQAALAYKSFIAKALDCVAADRALVGDFSGARPLFERALALAPNLQTSRLDYASAAVDAKDFPVAERSARELLVALPRECKDANCAKAHFLLGRSLFSTGSIRDAKLQFEAAVDIEPTFEHGYALARASLALGDSKSAAKIFLEMLSSFGDSAAIHMDFGRAYAEADFPDAAIEEFKQVLVHDEKYPEAHYCIGAAYLLRSGDTDFAGATAEFRKELALRPDDYLSLSQLGYIAMSQNNLQEAEANLSRAASLNPQNPDNFLLLGQIYADLNRPADAESALRKAIAVTDDPSRNHYQIRGAHYQLGRLLLARGQNAEGKHEMQITQDLLLQNRMLDEVNLTGKPLPGYRFPAPPAKPTDAGSKAAELDFERRVSPAIADAYNNLGVITAREKNYTQAAAYFEQSSAWGPGNELLDYNWGRASFAAKNYRQAAACLRRYLQTHPSTNPVRETLALSEFFIGDFAGVLQSLSPIEASTDTNPLLAYAYAESLVRTGDYDAGLPRLRRLESADPGSGLFALATGRALAAHLQPIDAEPELRKAVQLRPSDPEAKYQLASVCFSLGKAAEAQAILQTLSGAVASTDSPDPELYHRIGELQLAHGNFSLAVSNLETAVKLDPQSATLSNALSVAYIQDHRPVDGQRERDRFMKLTPRDSSGAPSSSRTSP